MVGIGGGVPGAADIRLYDGGLSAPKVILIRYSVGWAMWNGLCFSGKFRGTFLGSRQRRLMTRRWSQLLSGAVRQGPAEYLRFSLLWRVSASQVIGMTKYAHHLDLHLGGYSVREQI